ncbi:hypothetical protein I5J49_gp62 [Mycobacterium phage ThulaThula]|uniref:Uncharacterized protein n=1 Tax=Mycobacterium phage ThulaThula TaxID=2599880 RepID=A0A5J6TE30_9CAUD|nr:hypothetical protein I5J49_gp62 [Mycobacterium phage ThulaThula]QFG09090.1 hypothetical protein PBI_THULATHULA_62 [Mycobacterium phage ThulaThula]
MNLELLLSIRARRRSHRSAWGHPRPPEPPKPQPARGEPMSDQVDQMLESHKFSPDGSIWAPESLQEVRDRLEFIDAHECHCDESPHENALHDLANDDVPVLLKVIETLGAEVERLRRARRDEAQYLAKAHNERADLLRLAGAVQGFAQRSATGARARGDSWEERRWLDMLILIERAEAGAPPSPISELSAEVKKARNIAYHELGIEPHLAGRPHALLAVKPGETDPESER